MSFFRFDKRDYDSFAEHSVWNAGDLANLIVNLNKVIDGSFNDPYWKDDAQEDYINLLSITFLDWHKKHGLNFYSSQGDYSTPLENEEEYLRTMGAMVYLNPRSVYLLKKDIMPLIKKMDEQVYLRLEKVLQGKPLKEEAIDISEKDLFQILAKWLIAGADENDLDRLNKKEIIDKISDVGVGNDRGSSTHYEWLEPVYPK